MAELWSGTEA